MWMREGEEKERPKWTEEKRRGRRTGEQRRVESARLFRAERAQPNVS